MTLEGWRSYKLGNIAEFSQGIQVDPKDQFEEPFDNCVRFLRIVDYSKNGEETPRYIKNVSKRYMVEENDLVMIRYGSQTAGQIARGICGAIANNMFRVVVDKEIFSKTFLYYYFSQKSIFEYLRSSQSSSTMPAITFEVMKSLEIFIPESIIEQSRISTILSSLDDKIELNLQMNKTLEAIAQAIFKEWFVDFRFPGFDGELVDGLPKGWRVGRLGEIIINFDSKRVPVSSQERAKRKGIYPYYGAASLMDYIDNYLFDGTYLLMGEDGSVIDENGYPVLQYVWGKFWVNNHAHVIQGLDSFSTEYIYILLQRTQISNIVTGAVQPKINQGNLNGIECTIPDTLNLKEFNKLVLPLFERIKVNHDENIILTAVRDILLPKLMTGKIRVA